MRTHSWIARSAFGTVATVSLCLCGCGQKGALYLPDRPAQAVPAVPAAPAVPATDEDSRRKVPRPPDPATAQ